MKKRLVLLLPSALIAIPLAIEVLYVRRFSVNVPYWDQWELVPLLEALFHKNTSQLLIALWSQHNEHRILFPRLIFLTLSQMSGWNVVVEMVASLFLAGLLLVSLGLIYRRTCRRSLWMFIPVSWLVFSLGQWENILWGWQLQIYLQVVGVTLGIYFLSGRSLRSVSWAILCSLVASFSFSSGLLIWPVGLACLATLRAGKKQLALWSLIGALVVMVYFMGYASPSHHPSLMLALARPLTTMMFFLANVGAPLGGGNLEWSTAMGAWLIALALILCYRKVRATLKSSVRVADSDIILGSLMLFSLLASMVIAVSRIGFGHPEWAINSRYITMTSVGIAGIYMLSIKDRNQQHDLERNGFVPFSAFLSVLIVGLAVTTLHGIRMGENLYAERLKMKYVLQTVDTQPDDILAPLYLPQIVRERAGFLREQNLSAFGEPVVMLLLTKSRDGVPAGEILPDRPVVQAFRCPVQTLNDVEILFATYARNNTSSVEITLTDGGEPVLQQSFSSAGIEDDSWVHLILPAPLEGCLGRELVLSVASLDGSPGNAITAWTYPRYYEGNLLQQPAGQALADRVIGLELNAYVYGLVQ